MTNLDELERLARAAPHGPWQLQIKEVDMSGHFSTRRKIEGMRGTVIPDVNEIGPHTSAYIAAANPATVLDLIERVKTAEEARHEAQRQLQEAIEARNGAAVEARRQNADLLGALKGLLAYIEVPCEHERMQAVALAQKAILAVEQKKGGV